MYTSVAEIDLFLFGGPCMDAVLLSQSRVFTTTTVGYVHWQSADNIEGSLIEYRRHHKENQRGAKSRVYT